jgi:uncharacterized protein
MNEEANTKVVQQAYEFFKSGDIGGLLNQFSDNISWLVPEMENVPYAGKINGRESVTDFFALLDKTEENLTFDRNEFVAQGDKVVVLGNFSWRVKSTNKRYASDFTHVFTLRDGKITGFHEYLDTAARIKAHTAAQAA